MGKYDDLVDFANSLPGDIRPEPEKPKQLPPTEDERLGIDTPLANPKGIVYDPHAREFRHADRIGAAPLAGVIPERGLIHEDPVMDVATTVAGGGVGKLAGAGMRKLGAPVAAKLVEPAVAGATTSALQGGNATQNLKAAGIGAALGIPGSIFTAIKGAPAAVNERLTTAITGGTGTKAAKQVASGAINDVLDAHPELKKVLTTSTDPAEKERAVESVIADLRSKAAPYYDAIDTATAADRRAAGAANVAGLSDRAAEAKRVADELSRAATPERDLFEEARKIDAPQVRELDLREAARRIDAPVSRTELANQGRERVASEAAAEADRQASAHAVSDAARADADRLSSLASDALTKLQKTKNAPGIDISAIDKNLEKAAVKLAKEGRGTEALAVGRGRKQLAQLYGDGKTIPAGTILPAQAVRTLATDLGDTAFANDVTTAVPKKALAQQRIYGAVTREIERAASGAGLDVTELRELNKHMSSLIPARTVLGQQRVVAGLKAPEDPLAALIKKPAHVAAGIVNGVPAHLDSFLANRRTLQDFVNGVSPESTLNRVPVTGSEIAARTGTAGIAANAGKSEKKPMTDREYTSRMLQLMDDGKTMDEAVAQIRSEQ